MDGVMQKIFESVKKAAPRDLTIEEIAKATGIHRNTVSKYVLALEKEGRLIVTRNLGSARLYTVAKTRNE